MDRSLKESFSSQVKTELAGLKIRRREDALALLCGFTLGIGTLSFISDKRCWGVHYVTKSMPSAELASKLITHNYDLECRLAEVKHERLNAVYRELVVFGNDIDAFMLDTGLVSLDKNGERQFESAVPQSAVKTETQMRLFIRGLFLACGMISVPEKAYHAEFVLNNSALADTARALLALHDIEPKRSMRKGSIILYIKEGEKLENLLAYMGASEAMMRVSNERIVKQAKNKANRDVNCISANLARVTSTATKQARDIELVLTTYGIDSIPESLRVVAKERLNNYELSLSELADELGMGRSAVNYRLKKLEKMAEEIRNGKTD